MNSEHCAWRRLELVVAVLAYLVAAGAGEELLVGGDGEAEGALDHGPDGPRVHVAPLRSTHSHRTAYLCTV